MPNIQRRIPIPVSAALGHLVAHLTLITPVTRPAAQIPQKCSRSVKSCQFLCAPARGPSSAIH